MLTVGRRCRCGRGVVWARGRGSGRTSSSSSRASALFPGSRHWRRSPARCGRRQKTRVNAGTRRQREPMASPWHTRGFQHPGPWWPAAAVADVGDGKAKAGSFGPRLGWCSVRTRAGARQPEATAAACAQRWLRKKGRHCYAERVRPRALGIAEAAAAPQRSRSSNI